MVKTHSFVAGGTNFVVPLRY